jgi:hypothetical protein
MIKKLTARGPTFGTAVGTCFHGSYKTQSKFIIVQGGEVSLYIECTEKCLFLIVRKKKIVNTKEA